MPGEKRHASLRDYWGYFGMIQTLTAENPRQENQGMGAKLRLVKTPLNASKPVFTI
jgi:hypothetical protein